MLGTKMGKKSINCGLNRNRSIISSSQQKKPHMSNTNLNTILPFTISSFQRCSRHDVKIYEVRFTLIRFCRPPPYFIKKLFLSEFFKVNDKRTPTFDLSRCSNDPLPRIIYSNFSYFLKQMTR